MGKSMMMTQTIRVGKLPCKRCFCASSYHIKLDWCPKYLKIRERATSLRHRATKVKSLESVDELECIEEYRFRPIGGG